MAALNQYSAIVRREGEYWLAEVPDLPGGRAFPRSLQSLRRELTDAVILAADLPDDATVRIRFIAGVDLPTAVAHAFEIAQQRHDAAERSAQIAAETAALAVELTGAGLSVRDAAGALDVTSGRVSQLTARRRR